MKTKLIEAYMTTAKTFAKLSHARRLQVGAIVVKDDRIISIGYNGMPAGWDNDCEDKVWLNPDAKFKQSTIDEMYPYYGEQVVGEYIQNGRYGLKTKPEVLHAETNAISKLARSNEAGSGADLFCTHAPCIDCAKLIYQSGIKRVFFGEQYRDDSGIRFLKNSGITVTKVNED